MNESIPLRTLAPPSPGRSSTMTTTTTTTTMTAAAAAATTVLLPPPPSARALSSTADTLAALARQAAHIQQTLQALLDAQSSGLLSGLGAGAAPAPAGSSDRLGPTYGDADGLSYASSSRGSSASGASGGQQWRQRQRQQQQQQQRRRVVTPVRQPVEEAVSLRGARKGLLRGMRALAGVRAQEAAALGALIDEREGFLREVERLGKRREGLEEGIRRIEDGDGDGGRARLAGLEAEERELEG
jgi:hypothetical protein